MSSLDRIRGCILGGVIGDAFGTPLEGVGADRAGALVSRRMASQGSWGYTDDGAMLIACAEALGSAGTVNAEALFQAFSRHYEPARGFGRGMKIAIAAFDSGAPWMNCAFAAWPEGSRGNGGAVRIAPVAVTRWASREAFEHAVWLTTRTTHVHDDALSFARLQAVALAIVLESPEIVDDPAAFHSALLAWLSPVPPLVVAKLDLVFGLVASSASPQEAATVLGTSALAAESVPAALWSFVAQHRSFAESVAAAALLGGDVDSICCLVGALAGALHGAEAIDRQWVANLSHEYPSPDDILALADALYGLAPAK